MLGIGFIIAHFVAMQKPQQRKYHSSCNRSVHRGTAHGKQEVKVCKRKTPHLFLMRSFCPLTGMVRKSSRLSWVSISFRPLTGMVQIWNEWFRDQNLFSPPYGDGTHYCTLTLYKAEFSSPCGDKLQRLRGKSPREGQAFAPLTGIVPRATQLRKRSRRYRPLTGMVLRGI